MIERRFVAYLLTTATADAGYWMATVAQGWLVVKLTDSPSWLGFVFAATQMPFLLFSLPGGVLADRFDRRRVIAIANVGVATVALVTAALVATDRIAVGGLALLGFCAGTLVALEHPVDRAWIYDLVRGRAIGRAIALGALEWATARTVGPALGGAAVAALGIAAGYAGYAVCVLPLIALALLVRTRNSRSSNEEPGGARAPGRTIVAFCAFTAVFTVGVAPYQALLPEIAKNVFGQDVAGYGAMAAAGGVGAIAGAVALALRGPRHPGRAVVVAAFAGSVLLLAFTQTRNLAVALVLLVAMGAVDTLMYALANTYVQQIASDEERGRANAVFSLAFLGGAPVGYVVLGALAERFGSMTALSWSAVAVALAALAFWPAARRTGASGSTAGKLGP